MRRLVKRAVGWDPGFKNLGYAVVDVDLQSGEMTPVRLGVFTTEKSDKKRKVMAADDDMRRGEELAAQVDSLCRDMTPHLFAAESRSFVRNARANAQIGMFWGMLALLKHQRYIPLVEAGPQEIRRVIGLGKGASKPDVHAKLVASYGGDLVSHLKPALASHAFDALAALEAARTTDIFKAVMR
jgi:Holliday junction resolvasome RuvABC endonuclease subunit